MENRRQFLKAIGVGTVALATGSLGANRTSRGDRKPNFVFFLIDDLGWSDVACYGNKFNETPNIDRLAAQGMRFTDAYAACPVCSPTRASIVSGQYPARVGVIDFITGHWRPFEKLTVPTNRQQYLPLASVTVAESLKSAGYACGAFGKWHLGGKGRLPDAQGFDTMMVAGGGRHFGNSTTDSSKLTKDDYLAEAITAKGVKFIEDNKDRPFFLYVMHYAVHIPLQARKKLIAKYEKKTKPTEGVNNPIYAAMIEHVDDSVGGILAKLDELKLADNTVVVFFSDNGGLRQHFKKIGPIVTTNAPLRDEKGTLYEGGIREPLIVRWPGKVKAGSACGEAVTSVDFYPTFLDIARAKRPDGHVLDGESITPLLTGSGKLKRDAVYWHYPVYHHSTPAGAVRQGCWKLIEFFDTGPSRFELYNLKDDIGETNNLAAKLPDKVNELKRKLEAWRKSVNARLPKANPNYDPQKADQWGRHPDSNRPRKKKTAK
jgi:arylsulfatase A